MQLTIPLLLIDAAVGTRADTLTESMLSCKDQDGAFPWSVTTSDNEAQGSFNTLYGKTMVLMVVMFYLFKVVPDTLVSFYNTAGTADSTYSRLMSLRKTLWDQGDDRVLQMVGYKMDMCVRAGRASRRAGEASAKKVLLCLLRPKGAR